MTTNNDNSTIMALTALRELETQRAADEATARLQRLKQQREAAEAAQRAADEAEAARGRLQQASRNAARAARIDAALAAKRRAERAVLRARLEAETRLREEQMRVDAVMKLAGERPKPRWPRVVVPTLAIVAALTGFLAHEGQSRAADAAAARDALIEQTQRTAENAETLVALGDQLAALSRDRLARSIAAATEVTPQPVAEPVVEPVPEPEVETPKVAKPRKPRRPRPPKADPTSIADTESTTTVRPREDRITVDDLRDPLAGLD